LKNKYIKQASPIMEEQINLIISTFPKNMEVDNKNDVLNLKYSQLRLVCCKGSFYDLELNL